MPTIGTRFGTRGLSIGPHRGRSTPTAEFPAPTRCRSSNDCEANPPKRGDGSTLPVSASHNSSLTGTSSPQPHAGLWEPYDQRLSRTVLREREGEVPSRHSPHRLLVHHRSRRQVRLVGRRPVVAHPRRRDLRLNYSARASSSLSDAVATSARPAASNTSRSTNGSSSRRLATAGSGAVIADPATGHGLIDIVHRHVPPWARTCHFLPYCCGYFSRLDLTVAVPALLTVT